VGTIPVHRRARFRPPRAPAAAGRRGLPLRPFSQRDSGRSTWLDDQLTFDDLVAIEEGRKDAPYDLSDLVDDAVALLDHLGIATATSRCACRRSLHRRW